MRNQREPLVAKRALLLLFILSGGGVLPLDASPTEPQPLPIDVSEALILAGKNSRQLMLALSHLRVAKAAKNALWSLFLPQTSVSMNSSGPLPPLRDGWPLSLGIQGSLRLGFDIGHLIRGGRLEEKSALAQWDREASRIESDIKKTFYNALVRQASVAVLKTHLAIAKERYERARERYREGFIDDVELLGTEITWREHTLHLSKEERLYTELLLDLKETLGIPFEKDILLKGEIDPQQTATLVLSSLESASQDVSKEVSPTLRAENARFASLENQYVAERLTHTTPSLSFSGEWNFSNKTSYWQGQWQFSGSLSLQLSLNQWIPGSLARQSLMAKKENIERARLKKEILTGEIRRTLKGLKAKVVNFPTMIEARERSVAMARRRFALMQTAYTRGARSLTNLEEAQGQLLEAQMTLLETKNAYLAALFDLAYHLGKNDFSQMN